MVDLALTGQTQTAQQATTGFDQIQRHLWLSGWFERLRLILWIEKSNSGPVEVVATRSVKMNTN